MKPVKLEKKSTKQLMKHEKMWNKKRWKEKIILDTKNN